MISKLKREVHELLSSIRTGGTFGSNVAITTAGTSSAYLIGFLLSPIIARIYQPEAYGLYALFNAFVVNLGIFSTLDYVNALMLPKSKKEFKSLIQLCVGLIFTFFVLSNLVLFFLRKEILEVFNAVDLGDLVYFVPIIVAFAGINRCLDLWNIREKDFKQGAKAKVVAIVGAKLLTIIYGIFSKGNPFGFIIAELLSKPITTLSLIGKTIRKDLFGWKFSKNDISKAAVDYKNYPFYNLPANALISLALQLPIYLLSVFFDSSTVGHFSLAISLINAPTQVIGMAFAQVFFQKAIETANLNPNNLKTITQKLFRRLIYLAALPFSIISVFSTDLFILIFGANWELAGSFAGCLGIMAYVNFISISICALYRVIREEKLQFYITFGGSLFLAVGLMLSLTYHSSYLMVLVYSAIGTLLQLILLGVILIKVKIKPVGLLIELLIIFGISALASIIVKQVWIQVF